MVGYLISWWVSCSTRGYWYFCNSFFNYLLVRYVTTCQLSLVSFKTPWLIDWLIDWLKYALVQNFTSHCKRTYGAQICGTDVIMTKYYKQGSLILIINVNCVSVFLWRYFDCIERNLMLISSVCVWCDNRFTTMIKNNGKSLCETAALLYTSFSEAR